MNFLQFCNFSSEPQLVCDAVSNLEAMEESYNLLGMWLVHDKSKKVVLSYLICLFLPILRHSFSLLHCVRMLPLPYYKSFSIVVVFATSVLSVMSMKLQPTTKAFSGILTLGPPLPSASGKTGSVQVLETVIDQRLGSQRRPVLLSHRVDRYQGCWLYRHQCKSC